MKHRTTSAYLFLFLLACVISYQSNLLAQTAHEPLLIVGGKPVAKNELIYLLGKTQATEPGKSGMSREEFEENMTLFINYKLKVREAETKGLDQTEEFKMEFESFKENLKAPFLIKNSLEGGELRKAYSRLQEVIKASHILIQFPPNASSEDSISVLKMALKVKSELESGKDFNNTALEYSDDPSAKQNNGDLGYFTALQMVQPFEDAAYTMKLGEISNPVLTNFGYHIIKVQDRQANPGKVQVSHILVRIDPSNSNGEDLAKRKINDIYTQIQKKTTVWEDIVSNFSEDPSSSKLAGLLPWFSIGSMIPEFEMAAFMLTEVGEISPPIRTQYGYHILRLENKKPLDSFENLEESIKSRILRDSRSTMIRSQVMAIQKSRYNFGENERTVATIRATVNLALKSEFRSLLNSNLLSNLEIFKINDKSFVTLDFLNFVDEEDTAIRTNLTPIDFWYERFLASELNNTEEKDLATNNEDYKMLLNEYRDGILLFSLMNQEVWQKGIEDSLAQYEYFRKNITKYQWEKRVDVFLVKVFDLSKASEAKSFLAGKSLNKELISNFEENYLKNSPLAFQIEQGLFEYKNHPLLSKVNLDIPYQELEFNNELTLVLLGEKYPAGPKRFEETRGFVIRDFQDYLDEQLIAQIRKKYPVTVNTVVKEEAFISLNQ
jgi:peptidyl-prolyl cis-trans isomerase SurA